MPIHVKCPNPQCGKPLGIPDALRGKRAKCPSCGTGFSVAEGRSRAAQGDAHRCPSCQGELPANAVICVQCGFNLKTGGRAQVPLGAGDEAPRPGSAALSQLRDFLASSGKWLLLAAASLAVIVYLLLRPGPAEPSQAQKPPESQKAPESGKPPQETPEKPQPPETPESKKLPPPPPPPPVEDWPTELAPPFCKAIARWDKIEEPIVEQYLDRLRGIFRGSFRLMEFDKAGWKFDISLPEQPEPRPGYVLARLQGEVRLALEPVRPGSTTKIVPLPPQGLFLPWYYVFPYAKGARVLRQGLTTATFEFSKDGGKVAFGGQELEIPPGAVPDGTRVTLHYPYEDPKNPSGSKSLLHCIKVDVEPAAVVFSKPATLRLVSARLPGAARAFQAHVARRGAKVSAPEGIAAILPGGPVIWAPAKEKDKVYGWDPSRGIVLPAGKSEQGWVRVPFDVRALGATARLNGRDEDARRLVGPSARMVPVVLGDFEPDKISRLVGLQSPLGRDVPSQELKQALEGVLESKLPVAVRVRIEDGAGQVDSRAVELAAAIMRSDVRGDLLRVWEQRCGVGIVLGADGRARHDADAHGPPYVDAMLGCKSAADSDGLVMDLAAYMHRMGLECLLYRLGDVPVAVGVSFSLPKPGVCSVMVEGSPPEEPEAKK